MSVYVTFDSDELFFRPGKYFDSIEDARAFAISQGWKVYSISDKPRPWKVDGTGFQPHFNVGLGKYIEDRGQYKRELKARGLIEVGNERVRHQTAPGRQSYFSDDAVKAANEMGAGLTDGDVRGLRDAERSV